MHNVDLVLRTVMTRRILLLAPRSQVPLALLSSILPIVILPPECFQQWFFSEWKEKAAGNESEKHYHREKDGRSDDIDDVKGPNVFERAKEEIEALIETIHPKKDSGRPKEDTD